MPLCCHVVELWQERKLVVIVVVVEGPIQLSERIFCEENNVSVAKRILVKQGGLQHGKTPTSCGLTFD